MSYSIQIYAPDGAKKETLKLADIFADSAINQALIHEYIVMYLANQRQGTARAKTRAEVQNSGRKLFRQKGTGRARVGDAGSPIRRKGGVAFGPTGVVHREKKMNQKMKQKALLGAFVLQLQQGLVSGVTELAFKAPKTKQAQGLLDALTLQEKKTLIVLDSHNDVAYKSFRNIPGVSVTTWGMINPYQLLTHKHVLLTKQAITHLPTRFHLLTQSA